MNLCYIKIIIGNQQITNIKYINILTKKIPF